MNRLDLWQRFEYTDMNPGLARISGFLREIGNPQETYPSVHIAGTNGKGSTAAMIAAILEASGYRTGLYTSPHLVALNERIKVNSRSISGGRLNALGRKYFARAKKQALTFFEFITAITFEYFREEKVDIAVLETGLGGRFDATNVIIRPAAAVITDIGLDHTAILGKTIELIAREKAGIIKPACVVISGAEDKKARGIIRKHARRKGKGLLELNRDFLANNASVDWEKRLQYFKYNDGSRTVGIKLPLMGAYQVKNAAVAVAASLALVDEGYKITPASIKKGIAAVRWPGRFDVKTLTYKGRRRTFILDGAHNPAAMRTFAGSFNKSIWAKTEYDLIFGVLKDKDYVKIAGIVSGLGKRMVTVPVSSLRTKDEGELADILRKIRPDKQISAAGSLKEALSMTGDTTVIVGSLYLVGEALKILARKGEIND